MRFSGFDDEWIEEKLGNLVQIKSGECTKNLITGIDNSIPYFKVEQLNNSLKYQIKTPYFINDKSKIVNKGSIIFPKRGAAILLNKIRILNQDSFMDTNLMTLTPNNKLYNEFLYYFIYKENLSKIADTTSIPQLNNKHIKPYPIKLPSFEEQLKISKFISSVDKKVALLSQNLEIFNDFKKGLLQQIFTQKLRFADCTGEWNLFKLGDIVELMRNGCSENQVSFETEFPVTRIETISKGILNFDKVGYVEKIDSSYLLQYGDILLSNINSLKYIGNCVFFDEDKPLYHGMNLMLMRFKDDFNKKYLFYYMKFYQQWFQKMACQAVNQASINQSSLKKFPFYIPPTIDEQNKIVNVIDDTEHKINSIEDQIIKMEEFKKGLLQQMFVVQLILSLLQNKKHI